MNGHGDMPIEEFRRRGHEVVDWVAAYLDGVERLPVLARVEPGDVRSALPPSAPEVGRDFDSILAEFRATVVPGITHWNHPAFFAYFAITGSGPGILGEMLTAALNVNAMLWRTSPTATELEELTLGWLREMLGLPSIYRGHIQDTASTSTMVALAAAREAAGLDVGELGLVGRGLPALRIYCSEEAHSSVDKAAIILGIGRAGIRRIGTDEKFGLRPEMLDAAIREDVARGSRPLAVVATIGSTSTTSVDPVDEIAEICARQGLWLHVDAAYGGAAAVLPEMRSLMRGWERADSIVVNPHKWLFVPIDCSALFLRNPDAVRKAFAVIPDYLTTPDEEDITNLMDYGVALGRRFRALKLWMTISYFGRAGIAERIGEHLRLARSFAEWVATEPGWKVTAPVPFSTVCFRYSPAGLPTAEMDRLNRELLDRVNASGEAFLSHTTLRGRYTLRLAVGNLRTEQRHVERAWEVLRATAATLST